MQSATMTACSVLLCASACLAAAENLIRNGGFEDPLTPAWHKRTPDDAQRRLYRSTDVARTGQACAVLENIENAYTRLRQGHDKSIFIEPGSLVELAAWVKADLSPDGVANLQLYGMSDKYLRDSENVSHFDPRL